VYALQEKEVMRAFALHNGPDDQDARDSDHQNACHSDHQQLCGRMEDDDLDVAIRVTDISVENKRTIGRPKVDELINKLLMNLLIMNYSKKILSCDLWKFDYRLYP